MITLLRFALGVLLISGLCACGKDVSLACDKVQTYQQAVSGKHITVPEGLDALDPLKEVPLPEASPRAARPPGSACIDRPPKVKLES
jgi:uncharacterized lipoprotein